MARPTQYVCRMQGVRLLSDIREDETHLTTDTANMKTKHCACISFHVCTTSGCQHGFIVQMSTLQQSEILISTSIIQILCPRKMIMTSVSDQFSGCLDVCAIVQGTIISDQCNVVGRESY